MRKIYLAGSGGMLGQAFHQVFGSDYELRCTDKDVNEPWLDLLDFRDLDGYRKDVEAFRPDYLFHLGAHTDLEYCEQHVEDTYLTNTTSVENAVWIANRLDIPLLYISTAGTVITITARRVRHIARSRPGAALAASCPAALNAAPSISR